MAPLRPLIKCQVSRTPLRASKNVKFQLSRNSTKFDVVVKLRKTISMEKSVSSSEIYKNSGFLPKLRFYPFSRKLNFLGVSHLGPTVIVNRYRHDPSKGHWQAVKWVLRYLLKTVDVGLVFERDNTCDQYVISFVDQIVLVTWININQQPLCVYSFRSTSKLEVYEAY